MTHVNDPHAALPFGPAALGPGPELPPTRLDEALGGLQVTGRRWGAIPRAGRSEALESVAASLRANAEPIATTADAETRLGRDRLRTEIERTAAQFELYAALLQTPTFAAQRTEAGGSAPSPHDRLDQCMVPVGPVIVFGAGNFPLAFGVAGTDAASALAAGCAVASVLHPGHPQTSRQVHAVMSKALSEAMDGSAPTILIETHSDARAAVQHDSVSAIAFTGSQHVGRMLFDLSMARKHPIPFYGELGSVNPVIVLPNTDSHSIAQGFVASLTLSAGQYCTNPGLLLVPKGSTVIPAVANLLQHQQSMPMVSEATARRFAASIEDLQGQSGISTVVLGTHGSPDAASVRPSLMLLDASTALQTGTDAFRECFGPAAVAIEYADMRQLGDIIAALPGALVASVFAPTDEVPHWLLGRLMEKVGRIVINGWPTGVRVHPFQTHSGPWPASTSPRDSSVGELAVLRFLRPVTFQGLPEGTGPASLTLGWGANPRV